MEKKLILLPSEKMDKNKKEERNEHNLIRMPKIVRDQLDPDDIGLEVSNKKTVSLSTFKAYAEDLKIAQAAVGDKELDRVCFVTTQNFKLLGGIDAPFIEINASNTFLDMLIGTDPELLIMQNDKVVNASNVLTNNKQAQFGADGAMAELRPAPASTSIELVSNIRKVLNSKDNTKALEKYDLVSACYVDGGDRDYPVGAHVHIGNPKKIENLKIEERLRLFAVTNKILDELLTIPLIRLDGEKGHNRRAKCKMSVHNGYNTGKYGKGYGFFGEWREAHGRLEHRSLSGLILSRPDLCRAVFGTAKAIAEAVYKEAIRNKLDKKFILPEEFSQKEIYQNNFNSWANIPLAATFDCVTPSNIIANMMDSSSREEVSVNFIKRWLKKVRTLPTYKKYEQDIETLGTILSCSAKTLDSIENNIKSTWKE